MQKMKKMTKMNSNKGFSFIEIIIAIAILAIIVLPLLNAFVTSSKLNERSKNKLLAIETAKNIMEKMNRYNLAEIAKGVNPSIASDLNFGNVGFNELEYSASENKYILTTDTSIRLNATTGKYDFHPRGDNKYCYFLKDIDSGGFKANALITVSKPAISAGAISNLVPMNSNRDIIIDGTVTEGAVVSKIKNDSSYPDGIKNKVTENSIRREIHITVEAGGIATVKTEYRYFAEGVGEQFININDLKTEIVDSPKEELRSIYLFIEPWMQSGKNEKIVINNPSNQKFNLYLIKQGTANLGTKKILVDINDGSLNPSRKSDIKMFTNIPNANSRYRYYCNGILYATDCISIKEYLVDNKSAGEVNNLERLYDIEVKIFSNNVNEDSIVSAEPLVTLTGGMSN